MKEAGLAYRNGDRQAARSAALSAYLDGFEMIEQQLAAVDGDLMRRAEADFMAVREAIDRSHEADIVSERVATARASLAEATDALSGDGLSPAATFSASFFILFREGLEHCWWWQPCLPLPVRPMRSAPPAIFIWAGSLLWWPVA